VIAGCARNCGRYLRGSLALMERLAGVFEASRAIIVENGSEDETKGILKVWRERESKLGKVVLHVDEELEDVSRRTARLAMARNRYIEHIATTAVKGYDFLIVMDLDGVNVGSRLAEEMPKACSFLRSRASPAGLFANQAGPYYDVWALRHQRWCPGDCWRQVERYACVLGWKRATRLFVHDRQSVISPDAPPIRVRSAFGGFAIYKLSYALGARYVGIDRRGREVCEHVAFNEDICRAGGELYIFPRLLNSTAAEHVAAEPLVLSPVERRLRDLADRVEGCFA
jgi:hypothetical protein